MEFLNHPLVACLGAAVVFAVIMLGVPALADWLFNKALDGQGFATPRMSNHKQRGMVLLGRSYKGYASGTVVQLPTQEEAALIAQSFATTSAGPVTTGAVTTTATVGRVAIAAGSSSVVVTQPQVDANSKIFAVVSQAAADGTLLRVERIVPAAGSFTIYGTANATATTVIDWFLMPSSQGLLPPQA